VGFSRDTGARLAVRGFGACRPLRLTERGDAPREQDDGLESRPGTDPRRTAAEPSLAVGSSGRSRPAVENGRGRPGRSGCFATGRRAVGRQPDNQRNRLLRRMTTTTARSARRSAVSGPPGQTGLQRHAFPLRRSVRPTLLAVALLVGCRTPEPDFAVPSRHSVRSDNLLILSNFRLGREHPLVQDLLELQREITTTLALPAPNREVVLYLFSNERQYQRFMKHHFPDLPARRAYFVATPEELSVYTFWGSRVQEDLRHEFTHGLLHATLKSVPLWLDEGLAEYFEVTGVPPDNVHADYARNLQAAIQNGWRPNLPRLESLLLVQDMTRSDYEEAWGWVQLMLHTPLLKEVLLEYVDELRTNPSPAPLSGRVFSVMPDVVDRYVSYVNSLTPASLARHWPPRTVVR